MGIYMYVPMRGPMKGACASAPLLHAAPHRHIHIYIYASCCPAVNRILHHGTASCSAKWDLKCPMVPEEGRGEGMCTETGGGMQAAPQSPGHWHLAQLGVLRACPLSRGVHSCARHCHQAPADWGPPRNAGPQLETARHESRVQLLHG